MPTCLVTVFAKNDIENLTQAQTNQLRTIGERIVAEWRARLRKEQGG
jgi:hypothetical protein